MLLALDTATRQSGIALLEAGGLLAEMNWTSQTGQTTELLPRLSQLLEWQNRSLADVEVIAVGLGPGSFTGLRVALSAAKGIALANEVPLVGVPTLDATAWPFIDNETGVCAVGARRTWPPLLVAIRRAIGTAVTPGHVGGAAILVQPRSTERSGNHGTVADRLDDCGGRFAAGGLAGAGSAAR